MTFYNSGVFSREQIDAAILNISELGGYLNVECFRWGWDNWTNRPYLADYHALAAWMFNEKFYFPYRSIHFPLTI